VGEIGDKALIATSLMNLGIMVRSQGDYTAARTYCEESLSLYREIGHRQGIASALDNLGEVARMQSDYAVARAYLEESLSLYREIGHRQGIAPLLEAFATLAAAESQSKIENPKSKMLRAVQLCGAAERMREEISAPLTP